MRREYGYDGLGRLTVDLLFGGGGLSASHGYGYDADGNLRSQQVGFPGDRAGEPNGAVGEHRYRYDHAGRLTRWVAPPVEGQPRAGGEDGCGGAERVGGGAPLLL